MTPEALKRLHKTALKVGLRPNMVVTEIGGYAVATINKYMSDCEAYAELFASTPQLHKSYTALVLASALVALNRPTAAGVIERADGRWALVDARALDALVRTLVDVGIDLEHLRSAAQAASSPEGDDDGKD